MQHKVICSNCNIEMNIQIWMPASLKWNNDAYKDLDIPHQNASHKCQNCGRLWMSTDNLVLNDNVLYFEEW